MSNPFFIGVDGGATKCIVRVEDEQGRLLGREIGGPANIRISVTQAWQSIHAALEKILRPLAVSIENNHLFHVGMGLAGCEISEAYAAFLREAPSFQTFIVSSDAHAACLGAHAGKDGAIIIAGTGVVGFQREGNHMAKVSGWGFPHDDIGGGAWLGLQAVSITLQSMDGRLPSSNLSKAIQQHFNDQPDALVTWANQANSTAFAELAPVVIQTAQSGDATAMALLQRAASAIDEVSAALIAKQKYSEKRLPCVLIGGIAPFIQPFLNPISQSRLQACALTPDAGAIFLVKNRG